MPKKVDANQPDIIKALRKAGASVTPTHALGQGFPDIAVGFNGITVLMEIKNGELPPSKRRLTPDEEQWHSAWRGCAAVVCSAEEALAILDGINCIIPAKVG